MARGHGLTHCPAHDDHHPSLSVSDKDGVVLWNCKAGCDQGVITHAIHQLFPTPERARPDVKPRETVYDYTPLGYPARHMRRDFPDGKKRMWWEPPGTRMADLPLWNGDMLTERRFDGEPALLVEGEKDANNGVRFGFLCVSLPGGASQRDFGAALDPLAGWWVVLIPDQDKPGLALMEAVYTALRRVGSKKISLLDLPDHDLSDYLERCPDGSLREFRAGFKDMIDQATVLSDG